MEEFKTVVGSVWTWVAIGSACAMGVWWDKMSPRRSNLTLCIGVVALTGAVFLIPQVASWGMPARLLATFIAGIWLAIAAYFLLWSTPPPEVSVSPKVITVQSAEMSVRAPVTLTNHTESPRYDVVVCFVPSHPQIEFKLIPTDPPSDQVTIGGIGIAVDWIIMHQGDGQYLTVPHLKPREVLSIRLLAQLKADGVRGTIAVSTDGGSPTYTPSVMQGKLSDFK